MPERLRIYIAGPYTAEDEASIWNNVVAAIDAGIEIYKRGHYPYVPHLTHFVDKRSSETGAGLRWEDYLVWDREWLKQCNAFFLLGKSPGSDLELKWAKGLGLRVFQSLDEIPRLSRHSLDREVARATPTGPSGD